MASPKRFLSGKLVIPKEIDVSESVNDGFGVPVGTIITSVLHAAPEGYLNCNGETHNIDDYPDLAAAFEASYGASNYFGGDGETTFAMPNLTDVSIYGEHVKVSHYIKY